MTEGGRYFLKQVVETICDHAFRKEREKLKLIEELAKGKDHVQCYCCKVCGSIVKQKHDCIFCPCYEQIGCNWCVDDDNTAVCNTCGKYVCQKCFNKCDVANCEFKTCHRCKTNCACKKRYCAYDVGSCQDCGMRNLCPFCERHWCRIEKKVVEKILPPSEEEEESFETQRLSPIL